MTAATNSLSCLGAQFGNHGLRNFTFERKLDIFERKLDIFERKLDICVEMENQMLTVWVEFR